MLAIVAEKTGYPQDMLDLDLDLEADLGVDTVKQAETFAAIRAAFDIPRRKSLKLRDYPTLASVIGFVYTDAARPGSAEQRRRAEPPAAAPERHDRGRGAAATAVTGRSPAADPVAATGAGDRGREDRLPAGHARSGPGSGGRPGRRHGQAGRDLRRHPRGVRHSRARKNLKLRDYPTLASVIGFVYTRCGRTWRQRPADAAGADAPA